MTDKLKVGVIGVGSMGRNHARIYSEVADIVGVCDASADVARKVGEQFGCEGYTDLDAFIKESGVEAVTVATPTTHHAETAVRCLEAGLHVLVEKPIADNIADGERILKAAAGSGTILSVGMVERHNPIVMFTSEMLEKGRLGEVVTISSRRVSNLPIRIKDVGVITDLGVHDIDVLRYLAKGEVRSVYALGGHVKTDEFEDHATILLEFDNGVEGVMEVSWLTPMKVRGITITGLEGVAEMDFVDQELRVSTSTYGDLDMGNLWRIPQMYDIRRIRVRQEEPLRREIIDFLEAVGIGRDPLITGSDGLKTLAIAKAAERSIKTGRKVELE